MPKLTERKCPHCHKVMDRMECERQVTEFGHIVYDDSITDPESVQIYFDCSEAMQEAEHKYFCTYCGEIITSDDDEAKRIMTMK